MCILQEELKSVLIDYTQFLCDVGGKQRYQKARVCISSTISSVLGCSVFCCLQAAVSFYMEDAGRNECGLTFGNLFSLTIGFDCLFNNKHP